MTTRKPQVKRRRLRVAVVGLLGAMALGVVTYLALVTLAWWNYGQVLEPKDADAFLERFMPRYEVVERHSIRVAAPAEITFATASELDLLASPVIRAIFKARELAMGVAGDARARPHRFIAEMKSLGWGVLAETPGREIVMGAVTKPWEAKVVFTPLPPAEFAAFQEPGFAKIVWTLRADPVDATHSIFRTETRVSTTDPASRARFRRYWAWVSPGIWTIRWLHLGPVKDEAERRAQLVGSR